MIDKGDRGSTSSTPTIVVIVLLFLTLPCIAASVIVFVTGFILMRAADQSAMPPPIVQPPPPPVEVEPQPASREQGKSAAKSCPVYARHLRARKSVGFHVAEMLGFGEYATAAAHVDDGFLRLLHDLGMNRDGI